MSVLQLGYTCPECGGVMYTKALLTHPPIHEAKCEDCGARYRRPMHTDRPHILPPDFQRAKD